MKQGAKIVHICSVVNYPLEKKFIGTSSILARSKSRVLPTDAIYCICQVVNGTAVIFQSRSILWIEFTVSSSHWNVPMTSARAWSRSELLYQPPPMSIELPETITIHDEPLKTTESLTYLGRTVTNTNSADLELERRIQSATKAHGALQKRPWSCNDISTKTKVKVYSVAVIPCLLYSIECTTLYHRHIITLTRLQLRHLRSILNIKWHDRIPGGTAPCSHSRCWSPNNRVTASPLGRTSTSDGQ